MKLSWKKWGVLCVLVPFPLWGAWDFRDGFVAGRNGSGPEPAWETTGINWEIQDGSLVSTDLIADFAFPGSAPAGKTVSIEATVTVAAALGTEWKDAGVAVEQNGDYWRFALIEAPAGMQNRHFVELAESLGGVWNAQSDTATRLAMTENFVDGFTWEYGKPYRMRLELSAAGIRGELSEPGGKVRVRIGYKFDGRAATSGRPGLANGGFRTGFKNVSAHVDDPVPVEKCQETFPPCTLAGNREIKGRATGFFRVAEANGKWWLFTPGGEAFYAVAIDHVNYRAHWCEKLGYAPMHRFAEKKYGSEAAWGREALKRLTAWNFNTLAAGHSPSLRHQGLAHTEFLSLGTEFATVDALAPKGDWTGFPNVFNPKFQKFCEKQAQRLCVAMRADPWLVGYFLDNELEWFGKAPKGSLRNWALARPAGDPARLAAETCDDDGFVRLLAERYFSATTAAIRKQDPNHLILGCRFAGQATAGLWEVCGKYCDIVSVNIYPRVDLETGNMREAETLLRNWFRLANRPLMISEWGFPALDAVDSEGRPLPSLHGAGMRVDNQEQKARCCGIMQDRLFRQPFLVGSDYFMWGDEPALGISRGFPEDSNYGLVSESDVPYETVTRMFSRLNARVYPIHSGQVKPEEIVRKPAAIVVLPKGKIKVERSGQQVTVDNGVLKLVRSADSANAWDRVELNGVVLGKFGMLLHRQTPGTEWTAPEKVESLELSGDENRTVIDLVFARAKSFRAAYRFTIHPGQNFFLSQLRWIENADAKPWKLVSYYHYANSFIGGSAEGDTLGGNGVPNYYLSLAAWRDDRVGLQYGAFAPRDQDFGVMFWLDETGGQHPDLFRKLDRMLKPGERFAEPQSTIAVFGARTDAKPAELMERIRAAVPPGD